MHASCIVELSIVPQKRAQGCGFVNIKVLAVDSLSRLMMQLYCGAISLGLLKGLGVRVKAENFLCLPDLLESFVSAS